MNGSNLIVTTLVKFCLAECYIYRVRGLKYIETPSINLELYVIGSSNLYSFHNDLMLYDLLARCHFCGNRLLIFYHKPMHSYLSLLVNKYFLPRCYLSHAVFPVFLYAVKIWEIVSCDTLKTSSTLLTQAVLIPGITNWSRWNSTSSDMIHSRLHKTLHWR